MIYIIITCHLAKTAYSGKIWFSQNVGNSAKIGLKMWLFMFLSKFCPLMHMFFCLKWCNIMFFMILWKPHVLEKFGSQDMAPQILGSTIIGLKINFFMFLSKSCAWMSMFFCLEWCNIMFVMILRKPHVLEKSGSQDMAPKFCEKRSKSGQKCVFFYFS